jgi:hypothetical protein
MHQTLEYRIGALAQWGKVMELLSTADAWPGYESGLSQEEFDSLRQLIAGHVHYNGWFTENNIRKALFAWSELLTEASLRNWLMDYDLKPPGAMCKVGIICAGNIPLVGLHDVLCVLLSGHQAVVKLASDDNRLLPALAQILYRFDESAQSQIVFADGLMKGMDSMIATGSNNSSRYFEQYFGHLPHIIRKSRTSVAVLLGDESDEDLKLLGTDIFSYFGLGCRNVSKMYFPRGYNLDRFFNAIYPWGDIVNHNKYANNYDYNKAVWLLNSEQLLDNGFVLLKEDKALAAPTGSLYYEFYDDEAAVRSDLASREKEIQCIVGRKDIAFGNAQCPTLSDYADRIDTLEFLLGLNCA